MNQYYNNSDGSFGRVYEGRDGKLHYENSDGTFGTIYKGRDGKQHFESNNGKFGTIYKGRDDKQHFENNKGGFGTIYNNNSTNKTASYNNSTNKTASYNNSTNRTASYNNYTANTQSHFSYGSGDVPPEYEFKNFMIHSIIAGFTGLIGGLWLGIVIMGVIIGIISFVLCTIIHLAIHDDFIAAKGTVKKIILFIVDIAAGTIGSPMLYGAFLPWWLAMILWCITLFIMVKIIKLIDDKL